MSILFIHSGSLEQCLDMAAEQVSVECNYFETITTSF